MILCYFVKMKKNILFINHSVRDGGPGRSLFYLLKHFDYNKYNENNCNNSIITNFSALWV